MEITKNIYLLFLAVFKVMKLQNQCPIVHDRTLFRASLMKNKIYYNLWEFLFALGNDTKSHSSFDGVFSNIRY